MVRALSYESIHATAVAIGGRAILLCGPSGAGKSDLGLRLIDRGARLVSDDYTLLRRQGSALLASPPATIAGQMEVRGIGLVTIGHDSDVPVALVVELTDKVERMPADPERRTIMGVAIPVVRLSPLEPSAPIKAEMALQRFGVA